jgi:hypothetical protein
MICAVARGTSGPAGNTQTLDDHAVLVENPSAAGAPTVVRAG